MMDIAYIITIPKDKCIKFTFRDREQHQIVRILSDVMFPYDLSHMVDFFILRKCMTKYEFVYQTFTLKKFYEANNTVFKSYEPGMKKLLDFVGEIISILPTGEPLCIKIEK
jgi:hypothetical protein